MYSAGPCCVCYTSGAALFVQDADSGRIFFFCPSCGSAWAKPPTPFEVQSIDPPMKFAPHGMKLPTKGEIVAAGLKHLIKTVYDDDVWLSDILDFDFV